MMVIYLCYNHDKLYFQLTHGKNTGIDEIKKIFQKVSVYFLSRIRILRPINMCTRIEVCFRRLSIFEKFLMSNSAFRKFRVARNLIFDVIFRLPTSDSEFGKSISEDVTDENLKHAPRRFQLARDFIFRKSKFENGIRLLEIAM